jgi:hypothetical protein
MLRLAAAALMAVGAARAHGDHGHSHHGHTHAHDTHSDDDPLSSFLPPLVGQCAYYVNLVDPFTVNSPSDCAAACLSYVPPPPPTTPSPPSHSSSVEAVLPSSCILFNTCQNGTSTICGIQTYSQNLTYVSTGPSCSLYLRILPRNETPVTPAVPLLLDVPSANVTLSGAGLLAGGYATNIAYMRRKLPLLDDFLYPYRIRFNSSYKGPGGIWAWDGFVPGSVASGALMGFGGVAKWTGEADIVAARDTLVEGIAACAEPDGFAFGYAEADTNAAMNGNNQLPSYVNSWFAHGMLEAGTELALSVARDAMLWFVNSTHIPELFPMDGGDGHLGPAPNGYNPAGGTMSTEPFAHGHMLYWMGQSGIGHSRMAMSPVGTQAEVDFLTAFWMEQWWLTMLIARNTSAIWARKWYPDNYETTDLEAIADAYILTGNTTYLDAVLGGWSLFRDPVQGWIFPGGSFALNENFIYHPGSYPLEYSGGGWAVDNRPTGELCPSSFWTYLNQRLHRLDPDNETFVWEMERSIINVGLAGQGAAGAGVRYFAILHKAKAGPDFKGSCCEGQSTRMFGGAPEFVFSLVPGGKGVYVDLYEPATILAPGPGGLSVNVTLSTAWPHDPSGAVTVTVTPLGSGAVLPAGSFDVALRIPAWTFPEASVGGVSVSVNGAAVGTAAPGTYFHLPASTVYSSASPAVVTYALPMKWEAHVYTGETQIGDYQRVAYTYGPFLMAAEGNWDEGLNCLVVNGTGAPGGFDPLNPADWMVPTGPRGNGTEGLTFSVQGVQGGAVTFGPYFAVGNGETFTAFPIVIGG